MLLNLANKVAAIQIPNFMDVSDMGLRATRIQKNEVLKEIHQIRKLMKNEEKKYV